MSGDKHAGRIDSKSGESNSTNHALDNMWSKGGAMSDHLQSMTPKLDTSVLQPMTPKMDTSVLQPMTPQMDTSILPSVTFEDKGQATSGTKTLTGGVAENNAYAGATKHSYPEPTFVGESPTRHHQATHRPHQMHAESSSNHVYQAQVQTENGRPFHAMQTFPAMRTNDGRTLPGGQVELTIQPGQYKEGAECGNLRIPPSPNRDNYYNVLLNAHYSHDKLLGTPAHVNAAGQLEAQYPYQIGIRTK